MRGLEGPSLIHPPETTARKECCRRKTIYCQTLPYNPTFRGSDATRCLSQAAHRLPGKRRGFHSCQFGWLQGLQKFLRGKTTLVAKACNHPNCLVLPFSVQLIRLTA